MMKRRKFELCSYIKLNICHMSQEDAQKFTYISDPRNSKLTYAYRWIHCTGKPGNVLIRLTARADAIKQLREMGISDELCETIAMLARTVEPSMVHFEHDADVLTGIPVYKW